MVKSRDYIKIIFVHLIDNTIMDERGVITKVPFYENYSEWFNNITINTVFWKLIEESYSIDYKESLTLFHMFHGELRSRLCDYQFNTNSLIYGRTILKYNNNIRLEDI